jgi:hypothetical protein
MSQILFVYTEELKMVKNTPKNSNLNRANIDANDEFYTQLSDIERELKYYRHYFKDKIVFCNADDPFESNFFKYFVLNFNRLGLKQLITTSYSGSPIMGQQLSIFDFIENKSEEKTIAYKAVVNKVYDTTGDGSIDLFDVKELFKIGENSLTELKGNGDFRSDECLALLELSDIVVTNPPFSLFREYVTTLVDYKKDFIIIGNQNEPTSKQIFPLLKNNKMWFGMTKPKEFIVPNDNLERKNTYVRDDGKIMAKFGNTCWFTNLDIPKRHEELILVKKYEGNESEFPEYDNYNAIEVSKVVNIPYDYEGIMVVPVSFLDKYNPDQFEIIGSDYEVHEGVLSNLIKENWEGKVDRGYIRGTRKYARFFIKNKNPKNI